MGNTVFRFNSPAPVLLSALTVAGLSIFATSGAPAQAISLTFEPQKGAAASARITLDDQLDGAGKIRVKVDVVEGGIADLRGLFFNVADDSLLGGLQIGGMSYLDAANKTVSVADKNISYLFKANSVDSVGSNSNNMNGGGGFNVFDAGVEIGKQGIGGGDDFRSASFTLSLLDSFLKSPANSRFQSGLNLSYFSNQDFGVRLMSVGANRNGSLKLAGTSSSLPPVVTTPPAPTPPAPAPTPVTTPPAPTPPVVVVANPPAPESTPVVTPPSAPAPAPVVNTPPAANVPVAVVPVPEQPQQPTPVPEPGTNTAIALVIMIVYRWLKRNPQQQPQT